MERTPELVSFHSELHDMLATAGGVFERPDYVAEGYRPHVTVQRHRWLRPGDTIDIDAVSIIDMSFDNAQKHRKVLATYALPTPDRRPTR